MLTLDDEIWAPLPVTCDQSWNVYRALLPLALYTPPHLYNAILALSSRHMAIRHEGSVLEAAQFKVSAIEELGKCLSTFDVTSDSEATAALATINLIVFYDSVESALGAWSVHFDGAMKLIVACGGLERFLKAQNMTRILRSFIW
jgi:Fungal specific transcription factor domain